MQAFNYLFRLKIILVSFIALLLNSCTNAKPDEKNKTDVDKPCKQVKKLPGPRKDLNITLFIDLSDRISPTFSPNPTMDFWKRDLGYIQLITEAFETHLLNKRINQISDNIKVVVHPIPNYIKNVDQIISELNIKFDRTNSTLDRICSISDVYTKNLEFIYRTTLDQKEPQAKKGVSNYIGSDIYDFFKNKVNYYSVIPGKRNILFIITDGYMYMSGKNQRIGNKTNYLLSTSLTQWGFDQNNYKKKLQEGYGFLVPDVNLEDLEIFVLGLDPKRSWEEDVLNDYWWNFFNGMKVKNFQVKGNYKFLRKADLPNELDEMIKSFIYDGV